MLNNNTSNVLNATVAKRLCISTTLKFENSFIPIRHMRNKTKSIA